MPIRRSLLALALVALIGACDPASIASPSESAAAAVSPPAPLETAVSSPSVGQPPESAAPTTAPTATAAPEATPEEPAPPGPAAACTGTDANRDFYESVASAVAWTVYCPVLPTGWFVDSGEYRLASGGEMRIAYRGPHSARLELSEGAFCMDADGCVPSGTEAGETAFGDRSATVVAIDGGGWAAIVDRGAEFSWLATATGIDDATFRDFMAALAAVSG